MFFLDLSQTDPGIFLDDLEEKEKILCAHCGIEVTDQESFYSPKGTGPVHSFTNPGGFLFHLLTFKRCRNYAESSFPEEEATWFPPYSWIILHCASCGQLLGWKYVAPRLAPPEFFGLIRESLRFS